MTKEEILENNKLLAVFIGGKYAHEMSPIAQTHMNEREMWLPHHGIVKFDTIDIGRGHILEYHKSWDWLVPVCNKIINEIDKPDFDSDDVDEFFEYTDAVQDNLMICDLLATYKAVVEFIKWYNEES